MIRSSRSVLLSLTTLGAVAFAPAVASAQETRAYVEVDGPRRDPRGRTDDFFHDGLYLRFGLGVGGLTANPVVDGDTQDGFNTRGGGLAAELMLGGSVAPGVFLGGAFFYQQAYDPEYTNNGVDYQPTSDKSLNFAFLGPFIDWYPNPRRGFHVGAFAGLARLTITNPAGDTTSYSPVGGAFGGMIGHDFWVAPGFSLGLSFHLAVGEVSGTPDGQGQTDPNVGTSFGVGQLFLSGLLN